MHGLILWGGFLGGWLLFAGPVYQAAVELSEQDLEREALDVAVRSVDPPRHTSPWWWLLPPVAYVLRRRESDAFRQRVLASLPRQHLEAFVRFSSKATGWGFVAMGALLIACKETYELVEYNEWPGWVIWLAIVAMALLSGLNTAVRMRRARQMLSDAG